MILLHGVCRLTVSRTAPLLELLCICESYRKRMLMLVGTALHACACTTLMYCWHALRSQLQPGDGSFLSNATSLPAPPSIVLAFYKTPRENQNGPTEQSSSNLRRLATSNMADALALLSRQSSAYLTTPPRRKDKAPNSFDTQLKATCEATTTDLRVSLLESEFQAWYAYFVANPQIRQAVAALSPAQLQDVTSQLCNIEPHQDVKECYQHLFHESDRADSRSRGCLLA